MDTPDFVLPFASGLAAVALAGCAQTGNIALDNNQLETTAVTKSFIDSGATLRMDPNRDENSADGTTNSCAYRMREAVVLKDQIGYTSEGSGDDSNGPWIGLKLANLPPTIQKSCASDADKIVWVIRKKVFIAGKQ